MDLPLRGMGTPAFDEQTMQAVFNASACLARRIRAVGAIPELGWGEGFCSLLKMLPAITGTPVIPLLHSELKSCLHG